MRDGAWCLLHGVFAMEAGNFYARGAGASFTSGVGLTHGSWDASISMASPFSSDPHTSTPRVSTHHMYSSRDLVGVIDRRMEVIIAQKSAVEKGTAFLLQMRSDGLSLFSFL